MDFKGMAISDGIGIGKFLLINNELPKIPSNTIINIEKEISYFDKAVLKTIDQINIIKKTAEKTVNEETLKIFDAHLLIANDSEIKKNVVELITNSKYNAAFALNEVASTFIAMFDSMDDEYFKERSVDIKDVTSRIIKNILEIPIVDLSAINNEVIIAAYDLTPSQVSQINKKYIKGIITSIGGKTSHTAIIARLIGIPMISNVDFNTLTSIKHETQTIIDGKKGSLITSPSNEVLKEYQNKAKKFYEELEEEKKWIGKKSISVDGVSYEVVGNIASPNDLPYLTQFDAEGVGLFRTEFLYLESSDFPTEEEQFKAYKTILEAMKDKPVVIRTMDIGGDKILPYLQMDKEENPFLGVRAVRLSFKHLELFKTQLRALLRASVFGNLKIMFPMIAVKSEFLKAKAFLEEIRAELIAENFAVSDKIELGIMIEIPASALMADDLAKVVDFFSIGTNDLIQYTMAADRLNTNLSYLYQPLNPAILKLISMVGKAAKDNNIWAGVCGEMAGDLRAVPLLLGYGITELSMAPPKILKTRKLISKLNHKDLVELSQKALTLDTEEKVIELVENYVNSRKDK
ncbi:MAG: phosphoenolpyruvate--protein phosphotransferase [Acholeplasma sp.]|nr:phosphoenolpyruvate--protein phosphotransferase [Acholeplasma sp.]